MNSTDNTSGSGAGGSSPDWWDRLYEGPDQDLKTRPEPEPESGEAQPVDGRIPHWSKGPVDLSTPEPATDHADDDPHLYDDQDEDDQAEDEVPARPEPEPGEDQDDEVPPPAGRESAPAGGRVRGWWEGRRPATVTREHVSIGHRSKVLLYNGGAAGLGHSLAWATDGQLPSLPLLVAGWLTDCGGQYSISAALLLGLGVCVLAAHTIDRWSRGWWGPLHFLGRVPLASAVLGLGLYSPAVTAAL